MNGRIDETQTVGTDTSEPDQVHAPISGKTSVDNATAASDVPGVGTVLKNKYRLESKIGEGGMGAVFKATDLEVGDPNYFVAVKLIKPQHNSAASRAALIKEVKITREMNDANIVRVYGFELDRDIGFMVMEYLTGEPLDRVIEKGNAQGMGFAEAWPIIAGMAHGLTFAHSFGVIHSDFKPPNVFKTAAGVKILDFGIARAAGGPLIGISVNYASCEMLEAKKEDVRDDVYGFGLVVYKLLSGKHPFVDDAGRELPATAARDAKLTVPRIKRLNTAQNKALQGALLFERRERTETVNEVLQALERSPRPGPIFVVVGVILALVAAAALFLGYQRYAATKDSDKEFIHRLVDSGAPRVSDADPEIIDELLRLGNQFLEEGKSPVNPMLLSENARPLSSAMSAFQEVRKADPVNAQAARGILAIVKIYKAEARRLLSIGRAKEAEDLIKIDLELWPDSVELKELNNEAGRSVGITNTPH